LDILRQRFLDAGGLLLEQTAFKAAAVHDDGVRIELLPGRDAAPGAEAGDVNRPMALQQQQQQQHEVQGSSSSASNGRSSSGSSSNGGGAPAPAPARRQLTARLLVDCMGHYSPIVRQMRQGQAPAGMVLVVGGCWAGMPPNLNVAADLLHTCTDAERDQQLFWEAFPAADGGRTTYMFSYSDAAPCRPSFAELLDTYLHLMPAYQGVPLERLQPKRILMGGCACLLAVPACLLCLPAVPGVPACLLACFRMLHGWEGPVAARPGCLPAPPPPATAPNARPTCRQPLSAPPCPALLLVAAGGFPCYTDSPLRPAFDRVLQIGDAGASQSPLSFGGFGSMVSCCGRGRAGAFHCGQH
jgi:hypothetical protein